MLNVNVHLFIHLLVSNFRYSFGELRTDIVCIRHSSVVIVGCCYDCCCGCCWILDGFEWNNHRCTYMYTWRIYSSRITLLYKVELTWNGNYTGIYTNIWIDSWHVRYSLTITWQARELRITFKCENWVLRLRCVKCHLLVCFMVSTTSVNWVLHWLWSSQASHKLSDVIVAIRIFLHIDEKLN